MRLAILSDTHGLLRPEVLEQLKTAGAILHAGDINSQEIVDRMRKRVILMDRGTVISDGREGGNGYEI